MPTFSTFGQQHIKICDGALAEFVAARIQELARSPAPLRNKRSGGLFVPLAFMPSATAKKAVLLLEIFECRPPQ
jgi:hypothetical protein